MQLIVIAWILYQIYLRFRGTQAERVLRGIIYILPVVLLIYVLKLTIITKLIELFSQTILVGLIVIFAPEVRRILMQLGGEYHIFAMDQAPENLDEIKKSNMEIIDAIKVFHEAKVGALIIVEKAKADRYYINPGFPINADISKEVLVTIFSNKSPLHDGAVIIRGNKVSFAGVILPMTENPKLDWQYGTRHRAAIGFSEVTDALCFVVSEETGDVSLAFQGKLRRFDDFDNLEKALNDFYKTMANKEKRRTRILKYFVDNFTASKK